MLFLVPLCPADASKCYHNYSVYLLREVTFPSPNAPYAIGISYHPIITHGHFSAVVWQPVRRMGRELNDSLI